MSTPGVNLSGGNGEVRLRGMRQLRKALKEAGDDLSDLKDLNRAAADIAADSARRLVPVGTRDTSHAGTLKSTIRASGTKTAATIRAGGKKAPYANAIQWGRRVWPSKTADRPRPPRKHVNAFIRPSLFLTEGAKSTEPKWVALYEQEIEKQLAKIGTNQ